MIDGLKPYSAYKESGVPWLGEVPNHWQVMLNQRIFREEIRPHGGHPEVPLSLSQRDGVVATSDMEERSLQTSTFENWKVTIPGDLVANRFKAHLGVFFASKLRGIVSFHYGVFAPRLPLDKKYFELLYHTNPYKATYAVYSNGVTVGLQNLSNQNFYNVRSIVPPLAEQDAIVRFLGHADRRIRRFISAKQKLIKLLEEERELLIRNAVTRGLDAKARLKPSGVPWLGEVPEHWEVMALRLRYDQRLGKMLDTKRIKGTHLVPYLRNINVQWGRVDSSDLPSMDIEPAEYGRYTVQPGDLLVCEGGEVGRSAIWNGDVEVCGFQKALHRLRPRTPSRDDPKYLYYVMRVAAQSGAFADGHQSTIAHLTGDKLRAHRVPVPPMLEQQSIVRVLDELVIDIGRAIGAARRGVALLRESRTRLVTDVVTGKLDVRAAASRLPNELSEPVQAVDVSDDDLDGDETEDDEGAGLTDDEAVA